MRRTTRLPPRTRATVTSRAGGMTSAKTRRLIWPPRSTMARTPTVSSRRRASSGLTMLLGVSSSASVARSASAMVALRKLMRSRAMEGTKIGTSASITNRMVRSRSWPDRPRYQRTAGFAPVAWAWAGSAEGAGTVEFGVRGRPSAGPGAAPASEPSVRGRPVMGGDSSPLGARPANSRVGRCQAQNRSVPPKVDGLPGLPY